MKGILVAAMITCFLCGIAGCDAWYVSDPLEGGGSQDPPPTPDNTIADPADGKEAGGFIQSQSLPTNGMGLELLVFDVDGNGKQDLLVSLLGSDLKVLYNHSLTGAPNFAQSTAVETNGEQILASTFGCFNNDDLPDLVLHYNTGRLEIRTQSEAGIFELLHSFDDFNVNRLALDAVNTDDAVIDLLCATSDPRGLSCLYFETPEELFYNEFPRQIAYYRSDLPAESYCVQLLLVDIERNGLNDCVLVDEVDRSILCYMHVPQPSQPTSVWNEELRGGPHP